MVKERTDPILRGTPAADISASEKAAVSAKAAELKPLMGIEEQPVARAQKPTPAPTPVAAPTPQVDAQTPAGSSGSNCMMKNMQTHQPQLEALGQRAQAAQKAGDQAAMMAIADTVQQIQMAGCMKR
jgi:predicted component of type VI protein secretion system